MTCLETITLLLTVVAGVFATGICLFEWGKREARLESEEVKPK